MYKLDKLPRVHKLYIPLILIALVLLAILPTSCTCNCSTDDDFGGYNPGGLGVRAPKIAFTSNTGLCVMNADGSSLTNLTSDVSGYPAWSPDGKKIAVVDRHWDIFVMNEDGSALIKITNKSFKSRPQIDWSPDSTQIVRDSGAFVGIYVMNADGSNSTFLADGFYPTWSPDGTKIAFVSERRGVSKLCMMNSDGSDLTMLIDDKQSDISSPAWSPDGTKIAFHSKVDFIASVGMKDNYDIYVLNADGTGQTNLTDGLLGADMNPIWSPDGNKITFTSYMSHTSELYVMESDGSNQIKLADGFYPTWSPDGSRIAFENMDSSIYMINADGTGQNKVSSGHYPVWLP